MRVLCALVADIDPTSLKLAITMSADVQSAIDRAAYALALVSVHIFVCSVQADHELLELQRSRTWVRLAKTDRERESLLLSTFYDVDLVWSCGLERRWIVVERKVQQYRPVGLNI